MGFAASRRCGAEGHKLAAPDFLERVLVRGLGREYRSGDYCLGSFNPNCYWDEGDVEPDEILYADGTESHGRTFAGKTPIDMLAGIRRAVDFGLFLSRISFRRMSRECRGVTWEDCLSAMA